jgi:hypothetical protein
MALASSIVVEIGFSPVAAQRMKCSSSVWKGLFPTITSGLSPEPAAPPNSCTGAGSVLSATTRARLPATSIE